MFRKMLKSDLKQKRGLSIVLFLFITVASVLVFVGGVQIYQFFTGGERNKTARNSSDILVYNMDYNADIGEVREKVGKILDSNTHVLSHYRREMLSIHPTCIDFNYFDESKSNEMIYGSHYLTTIPKEGDYLFTMDDKPFAPESGTVWISEKMKNLTGCMEGDTIKLSTDMGNICELRIAGFYKQPFYGNIRWYVVSEGDFEVLTKELFTHADLYGVKVDEMNINTFIDIGEALNKETVAEMFMLNPESSDEYILSFIIAIFIALVSLFLIVIVVMTIRFTMIAALKEEEREIGTLRAIGADSLKFRWLFAAKYIFFAIIGGAIGIISGIPLSRMVISMFTPDSVMPSFGEMLLIGILSVVFITALIIGFSLLVMRHINKVSVVDAIRGENRAERTGKGSGMLLHKRKKMLPSFYLACSDILKRFKRYVFLFIAYTLGVLIVLFIVNIKNSVINPDYLKYALSYRLDFFIDFSPDMFMKYSERISQGENFWDAINEDIKKAGIKAHVDTDHYQSLGTLTAYGNEVNAVVWTGSGDISQLSYNSGTVPVRKNEVAISASAANNLGLSIGDEITLKISYMPDDSYETLYKEDKFTITSLVNSMDGGTPIVLVGAEYKLPVKGNAAMAFIIDAEGSERDRVFSQLEDLFGADEVLTGMEYTKNILSEYSNLFDLLELGIGGAVLLILVLMTYLYTSVFIAEETAEIALLKSIGFSEKSIKAAHIFRILILSIVSVALGELLMWTVGQLIVGSIMGGLGISGFKFIFEFLRSFIIIPGLVIAVVLITQWLNLGKIKKIDISRIKDE